MTITFTADFGSSAPFVGPGHLFEATSLFAADPTHTYDMNVRVIRLPTLTRVCEIDNPNYIQGSTWTAVFGAHRNISDVVSVPEAGGVFGDDANVIVEVSDRTANTVVDGPTQFTGLFYDPVCQQYICRLFDQGSAGTGGFTDADRAQLQAIDQAVVLPSYVQAAIHVGLSGDGSLNTLSNTRALRVTVTAFPANVDKFAGTPEYFFNLGFFTMNVGQGWVKSQRLVFEFQQYEAPQALDSFGWTLTPGTTINVEELAVG